MDEENILEDMYLDLKINDKIPSFRNQYKKEYEVIFQVNKLYYKIMELLSKGGTNQKNMYITASVAQLHKLYQSCILLFERGLKDSAYILIRTIIELSIKIAEVLKNDNFIDEMLLDELYETKNILINIKENKLFDIVPKEKLNEYIEVNANEINGRKRKRISTYNLAKNNNMEKEYLLYRFHCDYTHQSTFTISKIIKRTPKGYLLDINMQLKDFKHSIAWLLSISFIAYDLLFNKYLNNVELKNEYNQIVQTCMKIFI